MHRESEEKKINVWAKTQTDGEEHSISSYINKAYFKNMKLRGKRKWSARKKIINIKYSTLWVSRICMLLLGFQVIKNEIHVILLTRPWKENSPDQFRFLGNCLPTPPVTQH